MKIDPAVFESWVQEAVEAIPALFQRRIENVAFLVEDWPDPELLRDMKIRDRAGLLAVYQGVALPHRTPTSYSGAMPDRIIVYRGPHETAVRNETQMKGQVMVSVWHEVGHYFGLSEKEIRKALAPVVRDVQRDGGPLS